MDRVPAAKLPAAERARARQMRRPESAARWLASRWALRTLLGSYLGTDPADIVLRRGEHGKPALADSPERLSFNLSHSGNLALIALTVGREVGVDVEKVGPRRNLPALAERRLEPAAAAAVHAAAPARRPAVFYREWVRLEARVKCLGGGLGNPPAKDPVALSNLDVGGGYAAALAVAAREMPARRLYSLDDFPAGPSGARKDGSWPNPRVVPGHR